MSVKFETIKAGEKLYHITKDRWLGWDYWIVLVKSVDLEKRTAIISWNCNPEREVDDQYFKRSCIRRQPKKGK